MALAYKELRVEPKNESKLGAGRATPSVKVQNDSPSFEVGRHLRAASSGIVGPDSFSEQVQDLRYQTKRLFGVIRRVLRNQHARKPAP